MVEAKINAVVSLDIVDILLLFKTFNYHCCVHCLAWLFSEKIKSYFHITLVLSSAYLSWW